MALRVLVDDQAFRSQVVGGVSRYFAELALLLGRESSHRIDVRLMGHRTNNKYAIEAGLLKAPKYPRLHDAGSKAARLVGPAPRVTSRADLVHHTYYQASYLNRRLGRRSVVTVYDMIPELFPEMFPAGNPHLSKASYIEQCDAVLCISEATKRDVQSLYAVPEEKLAITPLGVSAFWSPDPLRSRGFGTHAPYVLFVGGRDGYKDFASALEAIRLIPELQLRVAGARPTETELSMAREMGVGDRLQWLSPDDFQLRELYRNATCFVFPSHYEGFGLPTLEAMACGCPVVVAETPALLEVADGAALTFAAGDSAGLAERIVEYLEDWSTVERSVGAGLARAAELTWGRTVASTIAAYERVAVP